MKSSDTRQLPKSGLELTVMGLGCSQMGNLYKVVPYEDAKGAFEAAWAAGIRYFDTAPYYGYTRSERRLGTMLTEVGRENHVISTKVGRVMVPDTSVGSEENGFVAPLPFRPVFDYSHDGILRSFEDSRQRLGVVDPQILFVHDIGSHQHGEQHEHYWDQLTKGGGFRALDRLRSEGCVKAVGLGVNEWEIVRDAMEVFDLDIAMLAGRYTLLEQNSLPFLNTCAKNGTSIVVAGVFNSGVLAGNGKFDYGDAPPALVKRVDAFREICAEAKVSLQAVALQFAIAHPAVVSVVCGARNASQIAGSVAWLEEAIPHDVWLTLRNRGLVADQAPLPGLEE